MMKIYRCIIAVLICAVLAISGSLSVSAAGTYFSSEGFYYGIEDGEAFVHGYYGSDWDVVIRESFLGYSVTSIEKHAFSDNDAVASLSFYDAEYLRELGDFAFSGCKKLEYVNITSSIQEMGVGVFSGCTALDYVRFREGSLDHIPNQTFYGCESLKDVVFENEPVSIGHYAFANCTSLGRIDIPDSVVSISDTAFIGCDSPVIYCSTGSYAMQYAIENGIEYVLTDAQEPVSYILGDADGDGKVTIIDATKIQRLLAGLITDGDGMMALRGDSDGSGLDIMDATRIQRRLAGFTDESSIGETRTV